MKSLYVSIITIFTVLLVNAQNQKEHYLNPIFAGDYPDPSILVDDDTYYITFSSFNYYPGLPIYKSKDLVNWTPVTHAIQTNVGSVWAPDIIKEDNKYYIYFPANKTNWVVWANSIEGPWSEPIDLKIGGIDPGHFTDDKGDRYLYLSHGDYVPLSKNGLKVTGKKIHSYDGWKIPDSYTIEAVSLEGPKVMKANGYYFLTNAQGGTAGPPTSHMVITARSKSPFGPWENSPYNPVVKTWNPSEKWWSKGHGTPFKDHDGNWWMSFHGYENGFYHMGRQALLEPLEWTNDGWFRVPSSVKTDRPIYNPILKEERKEQDFSDDFSVGELKFQWQFYKKNNKERYTIKNKKLILKGEGKLPGESFPLLCNLPDHSYTTQIDIDLKKDAKAGLLHFYDETAFVGISADTKNIYYSNKGWQRPLVKLKNKKKITLKAVNNNNIVSYYYSFDKKEWHKILRSSNITSLNHNAFGGFLSLRLGLFVTGEGAGEFSNFFYKKQ